MASNHEHDFLSHPSRYASDNESTNSPISSIQPHLDTLFAEFARTRSRLSRSPPRDPRRSLTRTRPQDVSHVSQHRKTIDLRTLDYESEYDSHLMCPICHIPFIHPVVLECDHTFCASCYDQYRESSNDDMDDRSKCPACRSYLVGGPRKASRLITNMCNDLKVRCPNEFCTEVLPRGCIEMHAIRDCSEELLSCPDRGCGRTTKRKDFVEGQCPHNSQTHAQCECGDFIELGPREWARHQDEDCPKTTEKCERCGEVVKPHLGAHVCPGELKRCPGGEFGCDEQLEMAEVDTHAELCPIARLAPHLKKQSQLLSTLQEQLTQSKLRNEVLETGLDKIHDILNAYQPKVDSGGSSDIEEIERIPSPSVHSRRFDLILPAHLRALTPSPDPTSQQQHLLALHESLRSNVSMLENDISGLSAGLSDLDARTSMQIMNETLRIKEDLAHTNAALFSTRAQVQWLLNRERVVGQQQQQQQQQQAGPRGRAPPSGIGSASGTTANIASSSTAPTMLSAGNSPFAAAVVLGPDAGPQPPNLVLNNRNGRRPSGGSQERVKL